MNEEYEKTVVMVIDDEPQNVDVLDDMLAQQGWGVRAFLDGGQALVAAREEPPDLILLDIRMPGLDGYEVCRRLKSDDRLRAIPVIFLSAFSSSEDKVRAFEVGGVDYVVKPFAASEVVARSRTQIRLHRYQATLERLVQQRVAELAEAHRRLRIWDDAKNDWLNMLSHEIRTPLTGIFGITELLFMEMASAAQFKPLAAGYEASRQRIEKLIDDATTLVQVDVVSERFQFRPLPLNPFLEDALATIRKDEPVAVGGVSLAGTATARLSAEPALLGRACGDLLRTAVCCVSEGDSFRLETYCSGDQAYVVITIPGQTLAEEVIETFFEVGGQRRLFKSAGDFGLGAALARRIVRLMRGDLVVCNNRAEGFRIVCSLPTESCG